MELITDPLGGSEWKKSYRALRHTGRLGMFGASTMTESRLPGPLKLLKVGLGMKRRECPVVRALDQCIERRVEVGANWQGNG